MNERTIPPGATKVEFARLAQVSRTTLYKWLRGKKVTSPVEQAIRAAMAELEKEMEPA